LRSVAVVLSIAFTAACSPPALPLAMSASAPERLRAISYRTGLYAAQTTASAVRVYSVDTGRSGAAISYGIEQPLEIVFRSGQLYVVDSYPYFAENRDLAIVVYPQGSTVPSRWAEIPRPQGLWETSSMVVDAKGDAYVTTASLKNDVEVDELWSLPARSGAFHLVLAARDKHITAIACDDSANLYVLYTPWNPAPAPNSVVEYSPDGKTVERTISAGLVNPNLLETDTSGRLYVVNRGLGKNGWIDVYPPGASVPTARISSIGIPRTVSTDAAGALYVFEQRGPRHEVQKYVGTAPTKAFLFPSDTTAIAVGTDGGVYGTFGNGSQFGVRLYPAGRRAVTIRGLSGPAAASLAVGPFIPSGAPQR
jgi:hypothetical protein